MTFPASVVIREVAPRDGLQSEQQAIAPADRARLVELLADAGLPQINAVSFVSPKALPQMAGAADVMAADVGVFQMKIIAKLRGNRASHAGRSSNRL